MRTVLPILRGLVVALVLVLASAGLAQAAEPRERGPRPPTVTATLTPAEVKEMKKILRAETKEVSAAASLNWSDYRLSWSPWTPYLASMQAVNERGAITLAGAQGVACVGFAFVPVFGTQLAAICTVSAIVDGVVYHWGYCPKITINAINRNVTKSYAPC